MYKLSPLTDRVARIREKYHHKAQHLHGPLQDRDRVLPGKPAAQGILKGEELQKHLRKTPVLINEDEVIVGWQAAKYRACTLCPDVVQLVPRRLKAGTIPLRRRSPTSIPKTLGTS